MLVMPVGWDASGYVSTWPPPVVSAVTDSVPPDWAAPGATVANLGLADRASADPVAPCAVPAARVHVTGVAVAGPAVNVIVGWFPHAGTCASDVPLDPMFDVSVDTAGGVFKGTGAVSSASSAANAVPTVVIGFPIT